jgi:hypothetical protein
MAGYAKRQRASCGGAGGLNFHLGVTAFFLSALPEYI